MFKTMRGSACVGLCLLLGMAVVPTGAAVTADSTTWEGAWEGGVLPYGTGQFGAYWFSPGTPTLAQFEDDVTILLPDGSMNVTASTDALWYTKAVTANFTTGASVEWRFKSYYGTANAGQDFLSLFDTAGNKNIFMNLQYPDANPTGKINFLAERWSPNLGQPVGLLKV